MPLFPLAKSLLLVYELPRGKMHAHPRSYFTFTFDRWAEALNLLSVQFIFMLTIYNKL